MKNENRERFYFWARQAGCPKDQADNFYNAGVILQWKQLQFAAACRLCDAPDGPVEIGFGGARGGGKSHVLMAQVGADDCQRRPGLKCLLLRKVGKANIEHFQELRLRAFRGLPHTFNQRGVLEFANGSKIIAGHFQKETDIDAYLGLEYDVIAIEEATTLTGKKMKEITTCCRTSKQDWRPRIYNTTNPGGTGHAYYKTKFILPYQAKRETETRFIPSRVEDNRYNNPEYVRVLENLTGWQNRAWRHGDWDIAAGQFFTTFRLDVHVPDWMTRFDERKIVTWRSGFDYGYNHYTEFLLGGHDGDGNLYVLDEHAKRMWLPEQHAPAIKAMLARHSRSAGDDEERQPLTPGDVGPILAGSDVFSSESSGRTIAQSYAAQGITLKAATMDRVNGWAEILKRLGDQDEGIRPTMFIHPRCARLIECLPALQHDPNSPEDVLKVDVDEDGNGGDDPADALRYMIATKTFSVAQRKIHA